MHLSDGVHCVVVVDGDKIVFYFTDRILSSLRMWGIPDLRESRKITFEKSLVSLGLKKSIEGKDREFDLSLFSDC